MEELDKKYRLITIITLITLGVGSAFYHYVEGFSWIDALYFCVITLTTIGYGDITPHTTIGKLFTILYVFVGVGIIAAFAKSVLERASDRRARRTKNKLRKR